MKSLIIAIAVLLILVLILALIKQKSALKKEKEKLENQNILALSENSKALRMLRHEVINQNFTADMLLQKGDIASARQALSTNQSKLENIVPENYCANYVLNALLIYESQKCSEKGIKLSANAVLSNDVKLSDNEICSLFSSLFNTAINSLQNQNGDNTVNFVCKKVNESVIFASFDLPSKVKCGKTVKDIVKKYGGKIDCFQNGERYLVKLFV